MSDPRDSQNDFTPSGQVGLECASTLEVPVAKQLNEGYSDSRAFALLRRYALAIEERAMDLYATDDKTLNEILPALRGAIGQLHRIKPDTQRKFDCNGDANYMACGDTCVPIGCCPPQI